jgi:hypothetical protein
MVQHPTLVPKLHRRFPGGLSCDFDGVVSGLGVKFVRTYQFAGALSEQAQLIVSSFLRRGPAIVLSERGTGLSRRMPFRPRSSYAYRPAFRIDLPVHHELPMLAYLWPSRISVRHRAGNPERRNEADPK